MDYIYSVFLSGIVSLIFTWGYYYELPTNDKEIRALDHASGDHNCPRPWWSDTSLGADAGDLWGEESSNILSY